MFCFSVFTGDTCRLIQKHRKRTTTNPRRSAASRWLPRTSEDEKCGRRVPCLPVRAGPHCMCLPTLFYLFTKRIHIFEWFCLVLYKYGLTVALGMSQTAIRYLAYLLFPSLHYLQSLITML